MCVWPLHTLVNLHAQPFKVFVCSFHSRPVINTSPVLPLPLHCGTRLTFPLPEGSRSGPSPYGVSFWSVKHAMKECLGIGVTIGVGIHRLWDSTAGLLPLIKDPPIALFFSSSSSFFLHRHASDPRVNSQGARHARPPASKLPWQSTWVPFSTCRRISLRR